MSYKPADHIPSQENDKRVFCMTRIRDFIDMTVIRSLVSGFAAFGGSIRKPSSSPAPLCSHTLYLCIGKCRLLCFQGPEKSDGIHEMQSKGQRYLILSSPPVATLTSAVAVPSRAPKLGVCSCLETTDSLHNSAIFGTRCDCHYPDASALLLFEHNGEQTIRHECFSVGPWG